MQLLCASVAVTTTYSNVKSMVLVAQFGATAVGSIRQEEKTQRAVAASSESKLWIAPPLPHNEMLARTYSASNFGSITPLANQMTALAASWRCACLSISRHSPASTSVPHMTQLVPRLRRGLSARTLTARAMACEPLNSVGTRASHLEVVKRYLRSLRTRPSDNDRTQRARCA